MVQGRKLGPLGLVEHIAIEVKSIGHEIRQHDAQEAKDLDWLQRALVALGASAAPHCTPVQAEIWKAAHRTMQRLVDSNARYEDPRHEEMFEFASEAAG